MTFSTTSIMRRTVVTASGVRAGEELSRSFWMASAPRLRPMPQSPSPTMVS
jgi:hypothetical protein